MSESLYSSKEVAALSGTTEKIVRNEIAAGIVTPRRRPRGRAVRHSFDGRAVCYFMLIRSIRLGVPAADRHDLYRILADDLPSCGRWVRTQAGLRHDRLVTIETGAVEGELKRLLALYRHGLERLENRPEILGGEPVFRGTRLSVNHIGGMVANGVTTAEILEDYPNLSEDDVAFAAIFARMKPAPGRPPKRLKLIRATRG